MAENTAIEWCDSTFNPWTGCMKVSHGCDHCYAESWSKRAGAKVGNWGPGAPRVRTSAANWRLPVKWNAEPFIECASCSWRGEKRAFFQTGPGSYRWTMCPSCAGSDWIPARRRVFCASLADVFDNEVDPEWRDQLFGLIAATPNLDWLVLTKRIGNARAYLTDPATPRRVELMKHVVLAGRLEELHAPERVQEVPGWPGYFITSKGRVLSDRTNAGTRGTDRHELKPQAGEAGHSRVMLQVEGETARPLIHRLVLEAFDRQPRGDEQGCHINGDATNNALWNLRWGDQSSNWNDSKRHGTRRRYSKVSPADVEAMRARATAGETASAIAPDFGISDTQVRNILSGAQWKPEATMEWPLPWVWLGATIVNQEEADRDIPKLLAVPARVRFLSMEPLLGPVDLGAHLESRKAPGPDGTFSDRHGFNGRLHWVIVGGESGHHARPMHPDWARSLRDQCAAAGVPFLFKQWGEWAPYDRGATDGAILATPFSLDDPVQKFGKKLAGRLLDGRTHDGFPAGVATDGGQR